MPDLVGDSLDDAVESLRDDGFAEIKVFSLDDHAVVAGDPTLDGTAEVARSLPEPGDDPTATVLLWAGALPEVPANVPAGSWYYPHRERVEERGTDLCLTCHARESCSVCHEERLEQSDALLRLDPQSEPALASAVAAAIGIDHTSVSAANRGGGWFDVTIAGPATAVSATAREQALVAFEAAFTQEDDADVVVARWVDGTGATLVEIGFERDTADSLDWTSMSAADVPWVADRYAVPSG
jgi:hypothetical protein